MSNKKKVVRLSESELVNLIETIVERRDKRKKQIRN